jgi:hypothetical protein
LNNSDEAPDGHCAELYRYHYEPGSASGGSITCVSCDPSGAQPRSNAFFTALLERHGVSAPPLRAMSDDGSYVFFDSPDPLVSGDTNNALDVYEWEASGRGSCALPSGCVHLISSGTDPAGSYFLGASPDGSNVFFGTHARLVPQDIDTYGDLYDARICEPQVGNPCIKAAVAEPAQCEGASCHSVAPAPIDATPGSLTYSGPGNAPATAPPVITSKPRQPTKARRLASALRACRRKHGGARRRCEASARRLYGHGARRARRTVRASGPARRRRAGR